MISPLDYLRKKEFVQHRVDMEVARNLRAGGAVSSVVGGVHPGQWAAASHSLGDFFDRGDDDDEDDENAKPYQDELFPGATQLNNLLNAIQLKIGEGKGGGRQRPPGGGAGGGGRGERGARDEVEQEAGAKAVRRTAAAARRKAVAALPAHQSRLSSVRSSLKKGASTAAPPRAAVQTAPN